MDTTVNTLKKIIELLGDEASSLLEHQSKTISKKDLKLPSSDTFEDVFMNSNRNSRVLTSLSSIYNHGRLSGTGYLSILPVDQGIEHSAGSAFGPNPMYFDPENILNLAVEGGCNAVATTIGALALLSRKYAHKIPFIVKLNHNELLTYPNKYDQILFGSVKNAWNLGARAIGATIYFGSKESNRQIVEISKIFEEAHDLGMATVLWCYNRNSHFKKGDTDFHTAADLTGQANHLGVTIQADLIKQKLPTNNGGFKEIQFGKIHPAMYEKLTSNHPIDLCRYQVMNCYSGKIGLINSGGASKGKSDFHDVVRTAVINKRAGGCGLISGRKAFQRPFEDGIKILHLIQDVYLNKDIDIA